MSSREFTHRVKSISMAKFTAEEVSALRAGGNEVCVNVEPLLLLSGHYFVNLCFTLFHCSEPDKFTLKNGILSVMLTLMPGSWTFY